MRQRRSQVVLFKLFTIVAVASLLLGHTAHLSARQTDVDLSGFDDSPLAAQTLIAQELQSGAIDFETSLIYRAFAFFDDPRLPAKFAGGGSLAEDPGFFGLVQYTWDDLAPETQEILTPFVVRPTDSRSIYYASLSDGPRALPIASASPTYADGTCADNWISKDSADFPFKVWTHCTGDYDEDLTEAVRIINDFWARLVDFMGPPILDTGSPEQGGDERIDFYFVDDEADRVDRRGGDYISEQALAHAAPDEPVTGSKSSGYVVARRPEIGEPEQIQTMAHEFFHVLQDAHNWEIAFGYKGTPYNSDFDRLSFSEFWFVEATAEWVISYLYRETSDRDTMFISLHSRFPFSFQGYDVPLYFSPPQWSVQFGHIYGAYIYFLFLEQETGPESIAELWRRLEGVAPDDFDTTLEIINDLHPFEEHFRDFTVRNLNLDLYPGDPISPTYRDIDPTFPLGFAPPFQTGEEGTSRTQITPVHPEPYVFNHSIPSLSAHYYSFVTETPITQVTFDFTALAPSDAVDVDLITKFRGEGWQRIQIDPTQPRTFCREIPEEAISAFYLVITNHDMNEQTTVENAFTVTGSQDPCSP